jgi:hypothetical protein
VQPIGGFSAVDDLTVLPDGGPVVLASVGWKDHFRPIVLARFAADGHIDESFGIGGTAVFSKPDVDGRAVARTPRGTSSSSAPVRTPAGSSPSASTGRRRSPA